MRMRIDGYKWRLFALFSSLRMEQKTPWLKSLLRHLSNHVVSLSRTQSHGNYLEKMVNSVMAAISLTPAKNSSCIRQPHHPNPEFELLSVNSLKEEATKSFHVDIGTQYDDCREETPPGEGVLMTRCVLLVGLLTHYKNGSRDLGLCLEDTTGQLPCEVVPPVLGVKCIVLLKKWNLIVSSVYGNYIEVEELVYMEESSSQIHHLLKGQSGNFLTPSDVQIAIKRKSEWELKDVNVLGRAVAISEPFKNGTELMVIIKLRDDRDLSKHCHIFTQCPELLYLSRAVKLFEVCAVTHLKRAIMNKGKEDETVVLTTTSSTEIKLFSREQTDHVMPTSSYEDSTSPLRKKLRISEDQEKEDQMDDNILSNLESLVINDCSLPSYKGIVTKCLLPEAGVYELDHRLTLYLTHSNICNQGRGLREGAEVAISNCHVLNIPSPQFKDMSGLYCCAASQVEVLHFSTNDSTFKAFIPQNKLAHWFGSFSAMDIAWLSHTFLSLLNKLRSKKEAFVVLRELCDMEGTTGIKVSSPHISFLREPHHCPHMTTAVLSSRPLLPTLLEVMESWRSRVALESSHSVCWWRGKGGKPSSSSANSAPSVVFNTSSGMTFSPEWSYAIENSSDSTKPKVLMGRVSGNKVTGHIELCDETGSIPLLVSIPYHPSSDNEPLLPNVREGCRLVISQYRLLAEKTEESKEVKKTKYLYYIQPLKLKSLGIEKSQADTNQELSKGDNTSPSLYVYIKSKNTLKAEDGAEKNSAMRKCYFEAFGIACSNLTELQLAIEKNTLQSLPNLVFEFKSAKFYSLIHKFCTYCLHCCESSSNTVVMKSVKEPTSITVADDMVIECIGLPQRQSEGKSFASAVNDVLEVDQLVALFYLPKLPTKFGPVQSASKQRSEDHLLSFRGVIIDRSYRIDCDRTHQPWQYLLPGVAALLGDSENQTKHHIIALTVRAIANPDTTNVYLTYRSHESLPLGLIPSSVATFHNFCQRSSSRSGNVYFVNRATSTISVESLNPHRQTNDSSNKPTKEMLQLPVTHIYNLYQRLLRGCLSRSMVRIEATVQCVQHAFIQYQCLSCECTVVDGQCRLTCPGKKSSLNVDGRLLIQDGTGEAHLYVNERDLPTALGLKEREWHDLLDLVSKIGQVSYTKSNSHKVDVPVRAVSVREKTEKMFYNFLTRSSVARKILVFCQPFLSSAEQANELGSRSHRVWVKTGSEYQTLTLPRLQLRALSLTTSNPIRNSLNLLALLEK